MKEKFIKWIPVLALVSFVTAVFLIADGYYWNGIAFIGAGASLSSAAVTVATFAAVQEGHFIRTGKGIKT